MPVDPESASALDVETRPAEEVADTDEAATVMPAESVPADTGADHDPSVFAVAWDEVIVPALDVAVCPAKVAVASASTVNAPPELVAAVPASVMPLKKLVAPAVIVDDVPTRTTVMPLDEITVPGDVAAETDVIATDTD